MWFLNWFLNCGLFYLGWIITLKFVVDGLFWQGPAVNLVIMLIHLYCVSDKKFETTLLLTFPIVGSIFVDTTLSTLGILEFKGPYLYPGLLSPLWVISLWGLFGTSLNHSLSWVGQKEWLAAALGGIGGTASYYAGIKVGAAQLLVPDAWGLALTAIVWAIAMPLAYRYNTWLKQWFEPVNDKTM